MGTGVRQHDFSRHTQALSKACPEQWHEQAWHEQAVKHLEKVVQEEACTVHGSHAAFQLKAARVYQLISFLRTCRA